MYPSAPQGVKILSENKNNITGYNVAKKPN